MEDESAPPALVYSRFLMSIPADTLSELGHTTDSTQGSDLFSSSSSRTQEGPVPLPACIFLRLHHIFGACVMLNKNYYDRVTFIHFWRMYSWDHCWSTDSQTDYMTKKKKNLISLKITDL